MLENFKDIPGEFLVFEDFGGGGVKLQEPVETLYSV